MYTVIGGRRLGGDQRVVRVWVSALRVRPVTAGPWLEWVGSGRLGFGIGDERAPSLQLQRKEEATSAAVGGGAWERAGVRAAGHIGIRRLLYFVGRMPTYMLFPWVAAEATSWFG